MTPTKIEMFTERDGHEPWNEGEEFFLMDITLKNLSDEAVVAEDIIDLGIALEGEEFKHENEWNMDYDSFVEELEDDHEIDPDEELDVQLIFEVEPSDYFIFTHLGV